MVVDTLGNGNCNVAMCNFKILCNEDHVASCHPLHCKPKKCSHASSFNIFDFYFCNFPANPLCLMHLYKVFLNLILSEVFVFQKLKLFNILTDILSTNLFNSFFSVC